MTQHLTLTAPLGGLAPLTEYDLVPVADTTGVWSMRSTELPQIRLFVVDAAVYRPDFRPPVDSGVTRLLLVATPRDGGVTVNLLAPIAVDESAGTAVQLVLSDDLDRLRAPLLTA